MKKIYWGLLLLCWTFPLQAQSLRFLDPSLARQFEDPEGQYTQARSPATFAAPEDPDGRMSLRFTNCNGYLDASIGGYQPVGGADYQAAFEYRNCALLWLLVRSRPSAPAPAPAIEELDLSAFEPFKSQGAINLKELAAITKGLFQPKPNGLTLSANGLQLGAFWVLEGDLDGEGGTDHLLELQLGASRQWILALSRPGGVSVVSLDELIRHSRR
ncbi:MAG: hypothetical protein RRB13_10115 [bacterium]|nr:hypothetical protein [bacterium]